MVQRSKRWSKRPLFIIGLCLLLKHLMLWWHAWLLVHAKNKAPAKIQKQTKCCLLTQESNSFPLKLKQLVEHNARVEKKMCPKVIPYYCSKHPADPVGQRKLALLWYDAKAALPMFIKFEFCDRLMSSFVCHKFEFCGIVGCGWGAGKLTCEERCCMIIFFLNLRCCMMD